MAETDILNPADWVGAGLDFNPNPSYSSPLVPGDNSQTQRARMGAPYTREVSNFGHTFTLQWIGTSPSIKDRVVKFFHDFKSGYFTYIDIDGNGRQYVGRFTSRPNPSQAAHGKWNIQGLTFEEMPQARMLVYPSDFSIYGHPINVVDDWLGLRVAAMVGSWAAQPVPGATSVTDPTQFEVFNAAGAVGDWAQVQYVGWGFQLVFRTAPTLGKVDIYLDGIVLVPGLDLSNGISIAGVAVTAPATVTLTTGSLFITVTAANVPLDIHRVKVYASGAGAGSGTSILFPQLRYIY